MSVTVGPLSTKLWQGLSTDSKPTATDPRLGMNDCFFERDTKLFYIWDGTQWNVIGTAGQIPPML